MYDYGYSEFKLNNSKNNWDGKKVGVDEEDTLCTVTKEDGTLLLDDEGEKVLVYCDNPYQEVKQPKKTIPSLEDIQKKRKIELDTRIRRQGLRKSQKQRQRQSIMEQEANKKKKANVFQKEYEKLKKQDEERKQKVTTSSVSKLTQLQLIDELKKEIKNTKNTQDEILKDLKKSSKKTNEELSKLNDKIDSNFKKVYEILTKL